jgi:hypothetical protein
MDMAVNESRHERPARAVNYLRGRGIDRPVGYRLEVTAFDQDLVPAAYLIEARIKQHEISRRWLSGCRKFNSYDRVT